jgi:hypothetical protein
MLGHPISLHKCNSSSKSLALSTLRPLPTFSKKFSNSAHTLCLLASKPSLTLRFAIFAASVNARSYSSSLDFCHPILPRSEFSSRPPAWHPIRSWRNHPAMLACDNGSISFATLLLGDLIWGHRGDYRLAIPRSIQTFSCCSVWQVIEPEHVLMLNAQGLIPLYSDSTLRSCSKYHHMHRIDGRDESMYRLLTSKDDSIEQGDNFLLRDRERSWGARGTSNCRKFRPDPPHLSWLLRAYPQAALNAATEHSRSISSASPTALVQPRRASRSAGRALAFCALGVFCDVDRIQ